MVETDDFTDREILAKTAWGEARSMGIGGMSATLNTVQNRLSSGITWWEQRKDSAADTLRTICLFHAQYSCWNAGDPNRPKLLAVTQADPLYAAALGLSDQVLAGTLLDGTAGADSYYNHYSCNSPKWARGLQPCFILEPHWYYRTVNLSHAIASAGV